MKKGFFIGIMKKNEASSSSSGRVCSVFHDTLPPPFSVFHCNCQLFNSASCVIHQLVNVGLFLGVFSADVHLLASRVMHHLLVLVYCGITKENLADFLLLDREDKNKKIKSNQFFLDFIFFYHYFLCLMSRKLIEIHGNSFERSMVSLPFSLSTLF